MGAAKTKLDSVQTEIDRWRELSAGTDGDTPSLDAASILKTIK